MREKMPLLDSDAGHFNGQVEVLKDVDLWA